MGEVSDNSENQEAGKIYSSDIMNDMITTLSNKTQNNNLKALKEYIDSNNNDIANNANAVQYTYDLDINLYKPETENGIVKVNPSTVMNALGMGDLIEAQNSSSMSSFMSSSQMSMGETDVWMEMIDNQELLESQYDVLAGNWPQNYNEVVLIVDSDNKVSDYTLYSLGLKDQKELEERWKAVQEGKQLEETKQTSYTYDEILNLSYKLVLNSDYYKQENGLWIDKSKDEEYMKDVIKNAEEIKIVGIVRLNEESVASDTTGLIGYTKELKEYVINKTNESEIVKEQKADIDTNVFTGLKFPNTDESGTFNYSQLSNEQKLAMSKLSNEELAKMMETYTENTNANYDSNLKN